MASSADHVIFEHELMPLIRERLAAGQTVRYLPFRGTSMLPMLRQGKDSVELSPLPQRLSRFDLPVYQYPSGLYVMHRVVEVREDHYVCLGDNTYRYEHIRPEQMIALVTAFKRGEKRIPVTDPAYRRYVRLWHALFPLRKGLWGLKNGVKGLLRRLLK